MNYISFFLGKKKYISQSRTGFKLSTVLVLVVKHQNDTFKGTNPALKKPLNITEIYAKMFGRIH